MRGVVSGRVSERGERLKRETPFYYFHYTTMAYVHIVLCKVKQEVVENSFEEFKTCCEHIRDLQMAKEETTELKYGPPVWDGRAHGFNYGVYSVFKSLEGLEKFKEDAEHKEWVLMLTRFIRRVMVGNVEGAALLTRHLGVRLCALIIHHSMDNTKRRREAHPLGASRRVGMQRR